MISTKQSLIDLRTELLSDSTVQGLIGARFYPTIGKQNGLLPYAVYNVITTDPSLSHDGDTSQTVLTVQIDVYAAGLESLYDTSDAIKNKLQALSIVRGSTFIQAVILEDEDTGFEEDTEYVRTRMDFTVVFSEG